MSPRPLLVTYVADKGGKLIVGSSLLSGGSPIADADDLTRLEKLLLKDIGLLEGLVILSFQRLEQPE